VSRGTSRTESARCVKLPSRAIEGASSTVLPKHHMEEAAAEIKHEECRSAKRSHGVVGAHDVHGLALVHAGLKGGEEGLPPAYAQDTITHGSHTARIRLSEARKKRKERCAERAARQCEQRSKHAHTTSSRSNSPRGANANPNGVGDRGQARKAVSTNSAHVAGIDRGREVVSLGRQRLQIVGCATEPQHKTSRKISPAVERDFGMSSRQLAKRASKYEARHAHDTFGEGTHKETMRTQTSSITTREARLRESVPA
jgi:hypothetical protein